MKTSSPLLLKFLAGVIDFKVFYVQLKTILFHPVWYREAKMLDTPNNRHYDVMLVLQRVLDIAAYCISDFQIKMPNLPSIV